MGKFYLVILLVSTLLLNGQVLPAWDWARNIVQSNNNVPLKISADPFGNVFVMGSTNANSTPAIIPDSGAFLARYNQNGQLNWAIKLTGIPHTLCSSPNGDVYVAGTKHSYYLGTSSSPTIGAFITKYSAAGNILWEKNYKGPYSGINALTVTPMEHVYVTGYFTDTLIMDNSLLAGNAPFFAARLDASGSLQWLKGSNIVPLPPSAGGMSGGLFITTDANENSFIEFSTWNCPNWSCDDHNLVKLDQNGNFHFYKKYENYSGSCLGLLPQSNGDLIMAHYTGVWTSGGGVVLRRYDSHLDSIRWSLSIGGWECQYLLMDAGLLCDPSGNLYVAGNVGEQCWWPASDTLQFGATTVITDSLSDVIVARVNKNTGLYVDAFQLPGRLYDGVTSISMDASGNCYVAGFFNNYSVKDASHPNDTLCFGNDCLIGGVGYDQIFLAKLKTSNATNSNNVSITEEQGEIFYVAPNPSKKVFTLKGEHTGWSVFSMSGELIETGSENEINLGDRVSGVYIVRVTTRSGCRHIKLLKTDD